MLRAPSSRVREPVLPAIRSSQLSLDVRRGRQSASPRLHAAADSARRMQGNDGQSSTSSDTPWAFGFQMNERYLSWDDAAAVQLIKMVVAQKLDWEMNLVESKLRELALLVPDMVGKVEVMKPDILVVLLQDLQGLATKLLNLREQLPGINVSSLVTLHPFIVLDFDVASLNARMAEMRAALPGVKVEKLVNEEPMLLKADIQDVLQNIRRLVPHADAIELLVNSPRMMLDMNTAGMGSALDVEGYTPRRSG